MEEQGNLDLVSCRNLFLFFFLSFFFFKSIGVRLISISIEIPDARIVWYAQDKSFSIQSGLRK